MPTIELTEAEAMQLIQTMIASNPLLVKIIEQVQQQKSPLDGLKPVPEEAE